MIRFEENKLIVEIEGGDPVETWLVLHAGLCDIVRNVTQDSMCDDTFYAVIDFIRELVPDWTAVHDTLQKEE